jgi:precorrin-6A/cobalt-precorrin-6A reductase
MRLLLVGGTGEARALAEALDGTPGLRVVSSLAGAVAQPRLPVGEVRVGGFGGPSGLARWLTEHDVSAVVDASHPFAARISASCVAAAAATGLPLLRLERPAWTAQPGDAWHPVTDVSAAAALLPSLGRRALLTTGRRDLPAFYAVPDVWLLARCVDPPTHAVPPHVDILLDRGPYTVAAEAKLLRSRRIDVLVTKNSGGALTEAKLVAARDLGLPVVMVQRPRVSPENRPPAVVPDVDSAADWVRALLPH